MKLAIYTARGLEDAASRDAGELRQEIATRREEMARVSGEFEEVEADEDDLRDDFLGLREEGAPDQDGLDETEAEYKSIRRKARVLDGQVVAVASEIVELEMVLAVAEGRGLEFIYVGREVREGCADDPLPGGKLGTEAGLLHVSPASKLEALPPGFLSRYRVFIVRVNGPLNLLQVGTIKGLRRRLKFKGDINRPAVARLAAERLRAKDYDGYTYSGSDEVVLLASVDHTVKGRAARDDDGR